MKTIVAIIFLTGLFCPNCILGQTYSTVITDKEIYNFLNWMTQSEKKYSEEPRLKFKQIFYRMITWDTANFIAKDTALLNKYPYFDLDDKFLFQRSSGTDTIFKHADRTFLFQQYNAIKDSVWHQPFAGSKLLKDKNQKMPNRYYYSIPLFSLDRKYVILRRHYYCGNLCAYGGYYIYKRIAENKWEYVTSIHTWIS